MAAPATYLRADLVTIADSVAATKELEKLHHDDSLPREHGVPRFHPGLWRDMHDRIRDLI